jgi:hypothetical protein
MASTRSTTAKRDAVRAEPPKAALAALARRTFRIQIAACTAAARALTGWAHATDRFAQTAGGELASARLATLPRAAADHFDARLARAPIDNRRPE